MKTKPKYSKVHQALRKKYTRLIRFPKKGKARGYNVELIVGVQGFHIGRSSFDTKAEAEWLRDMLATALENLVKGKA